MGQESELPLGPKLLHYSGVWRRGEIGKGWDCNTWPRRPHSKHVWNIPSRSQLQTNHCTRNSGKNAIILRALRAIASHELLHKLLYDSKQLLQRHPLRNPPPSPNSCFFRAGFWQNGFFADFYFLGRRIFSRNFLAGVFLLIFVGKSAQKNPPGKSPRKSSKFCTTNILRHTSADWLG